ncbi:MAG TPA: septal ring lytic transglycosylase RlpA family protein [Thermoanaerobaculia bacterium]|jgi:rare lipoprotein A|nr:septal ring lytic transglycosylase RlpA family protein [Thermoanaerobaculia bacterium]
MKRAFLAVAVISLAACANRQASRSTSVSPSASPGPQSQQPMSAHGAAGWVGQEFAGRTTANGEIFDPMLMTAAHRTLPFGTLLDVRNPKTGQTVRVRVNDRGPYVGDRLIDLSFAAAQQIGIAESGGGDIEMTVVKVGRGDREPPAAFAVNVPDNNTVAAMPATPTPAPPTPVPMPAPLPAPTPAPVQPQPELAPATVDRVEVSELHADGTETHRQVAPNGKSVEQVPVRKSSPSGTPQTTSSPTLNTGRVSSSPSQPIPAATHGGHYIVQVGAFSQEANAKALQQKLKAIGQEATIDHTTLYLVRIGPFETHEQAASVRAKLEASGISAIVTK